MCKSPFEIIIYRTVMGNTLLANIIFHQQNNGITPFMFMEWFPYLLSYLVYLARRIKYIKSYVKRPYLTLAQKKKKEVKQ